MAVNFRDIFVEIIQFFHIMWNDIHYCITVYKVRTTVNKVKTITVYKVRTLTVCKVRTITVYKVDNNCLQSKDNNCLQSLDNNCLQGKDNNCLQSKDIIKTNSQHYTMGKCNHDPLIFLFWSNKRMILDNFKCSKVMTAWTVPKLYRSRFNKHVCCLMTCTSLFTIKTFCIQVSVSLPQETVSIYFSLLVEYQTKISSHSLGKTRIPEASFHANVWHSSI